jgi:hypothetical protein
MLIRFSPISHVYGLHRRIYTYPVDTHEAVRILKVD